MKMVMLKILTSDQVTFENNFNTVKFTGLTASTDVRINTTIKKNSITNKKKLFK